MSGFYRIGEPGEDAMAHLNTGRKHYQKCAMPRFDKDDPSIGEMCGRMSIALCDAPGCDKPICKYHRTQHASVPNSDYCSDHKSLAQGAQLKPDGREAVPTYVAFKECGCAVACIVIADDVPASDIAKFIRSNEKCGRRIEMKTVGWVREGNLKFCRCPK